MTDATCRLISFGLAIVLAAQLPATVSGQAANPTADALADFKKRVDAYVVLHKQLAEAVGPLDQTKSQAEIASRATALATAIQAARAAAKWGDLFGPKGGPVLRELIRHKYRRSALVRETRKDTENEVPDFIPKVNQIYPTTFPLATFPPTLLRLLPPLPAEVEYRLVMNYLILRDVQANVILDVLPNAIQ